MSRWRGARTSDHDSGIGSVANTTKLSRETFLQDRSTTDNLDESIEYYQTNKSTDDELFHSSSHTKELIPHQNLLSKTRSPGLKKKSRYQSLTDLTKEARKYYHSDNGRKYPKKIKSPAKRSNSVNIYLSNTDDEEGLHSVTSSRSSGSGAESSDSLYYHHEYSKHGKNGFTRQSRKYSTSSKALRHESDFDDNNLYRRKPSGHSDLNQSDIETRITGSFENLHDSNELYHKDHLSYLHWAPSRQSSKNRLHRQVLAKHLRRSHSDQNIPLNKIPPTSYYYRPQTAPSSDRYVNMGRQRQSSDRRQQQHTYSSFYDDNRSRKSVSFPPTSIYSSSRSPPNLQNNNRISTSIPSTTSQATFVTKNPTSVDIDQRCVHRSPLVNTAQMYQQPLRHQVLSQPIPYSIRQEKPIPSTSNGTLYLDSKTGIIYRYVTNENITPVNNQINPKLIPLVTSDINTQKPLSRCTLCGSSTYHNHSQQQTILSPTYQSQRNNRSTNGLDDGYESEERKNHHHGNRRRVAVHGVLYESHDNSYESSSDADLNDIDYEALDETYERARIVQNRSHNLSRYISRQIKLVLTS
ncbi:unnamed protein product [Didymodactylos carnosus]|uniref:Uncharacterized protein n=1 Tax=Didymodactylos carnosus TaxID=1234261 RepID=A0A813W9M5_9BILA|nr:unnamed protein product [Didymodactylos carnosus]CAF0860883.1 unnamed protein product [Didymodactylos carnosus]CAF3642122.1 unnamed protein product [Didymodactylos carnosus]CAF3645802.1 unnamed protein product [Didymodactylos carnosus]